jgi:hypothetical protein
MTNGKLEDNISINNTICSSHILVLRNIVGDEPTHFITTNQTLYTLLPCEFWIEKKNLGSWSLAKKLPLILKDDVTKNKMLVSPFCFVVGGSLHYCNYSSSVRVLNNIDMLNEQGSVYFFFKRTKYT